VSTKRRGPLGSASRRRPNRRCSEPNRVERPSDHDGSIGWRSAGEEELDVVLEHEENPPLPLTDQERQALAEAAVQAYLAVLGAIVREAGRRDASDGPRNVSRHWACRRGGLDVHRFGYTRPHSGAVTT
jgi:hypothetical protein